VENRVAHRQAEQIGVQATSGAKARRTHPDIGSIDAMNTGIDVEGGSEQQKLGTA
jgi:hypothetical protein